MKHLTTELRNTFVEQGWVVLSPEQAQSLGLVVNEDKIFSARMHLSSHVLSRLNLGNEGLVEQFFNFCPLGSFPGMEQAIEAGLMAPNPNLQTLFLGVLGDETRHVDNLVRKVFYNQIQRLVGRKIVLATGQVVIGNCGRPVTPWGMTWHVGAVIRILHRMVAAHQNKDISGEDFARSVALLPVPFFVLSVYLPLTNMGTCESGELVVRTGSHRVIREYLNQERDSIITRLIGNYDQRNLLASSIETARNLYDAIEERLSATGDTYPAQSILCEKGGIIIASPYLYQSFNRVAKPELPASILLSWRYWADAAAHYPQPKMRKG